MVAPHYKQVLALMSDGLAESQAGRDLYFLGKGQAAVLAMVRNPAAQYDPFSSVQLLPAQIEYGARDRLFHRGENLTDRLTYAPNSRTNSLPTGNEQYAFLVSSREIERARQYWQ